MAPWEGVRLAPSHYPGRDRVLALAATVKMLYGIEFTLPLYKHGDKSKRKTNKYTDLSDNIQSVYYQDFKRFYDYAVMKGLP